LNVLHGWVGKFWHLCWPCIRSGQSTARRG
jgi:hypothetical protein